MGGPNAHIKTYHEPVMLSEVLKGIACKAGGIYVDATVGGGGHSEAILKASAPSGQLIGIDYDGEAISEASKRLRHFRQRLVLNKANFADLSRVLDGHGIKQVDGILADLGVSTHQLDVPERGFSFRKKGPLDMRMDQGLAVDAAELVNTASEIELSDWFYRYGEERFSRRIAKRICKVRMKGKIEETTQLAKIVTEALPSSAKAGKIHPATRVFQALRIVVNAELRNLEMFLGIAPMCLKPGGRIAVLSYHSLEDRAVKERFRALEENGFSILTKKPIVPTQKEIRRNISARSAKLRLLERL